MKAVVAALVIAACLTGCFGDDPETPAPRPTPTPTTSTTTTPPPTPQPLNSIDLLLDFGIIDCRGLSIGVLAPLDEVQALLPEPYTAAPQTPEGPPQGIVAVDLYHCQNFTTPLTTLPATWFGHVYAAIEAPPNASEATAYEYTFEILADNDILAQLWGIAGYTVRNGTPGIEDNPGSLVLQRRAAVAGYDLSAVGLSPIVETTTIPFARYTTSENQTLIWTGDLEHVPTHDGLGTLLVPDDSPLAPLATNGRLVGVASASDADQFLMQDLVLKFEEL